ncbi:MAG: hypothetical protein L3J32_03295 [Rhizobiaceae bacterium]|nr:hypothetical protein [Rhizobiaceae bacterium]
MAKNEELDENKIEAKVHDLSKSIENMKSRFADRDDVVVELQQSQRTRLEMLARDLQPMFEQVPDDNDQFEFALTSGETPRLWVDMSAHVRMASDRRQYELVKDTRIGRTILGSTSDMSQMGQIVTDYVANKILERERLIEGEWISMSGYNFGDEEENNEAVVQPSPKRGIWSATAWFITGAVISVGALFAWAWYGPLPTFLQ